MSALVLAAFLALVAGGCATSSASPAGQPPMDRDLEESIPAGFETSEPHQLAQAGLQALRENRLKDASDAFNKALKLDPTNSGIQFLNGLAYHLRALQGDGALYDLAQQGYELAIKFDQSNWLARYHLGLLYLDRKDYAAAEERLADAMLFQSDDPDMLYTLVVAAYNARDPRTAAATLSKLQKLEPSSERVLRASAMIMAAMNRPKEARDYLDQYEDVVGATGETGRLRRRLADWDRFYEQYGKDMLGAKPEAPEGERYYIRPPPRFVESPWNEEALKERIEDTSATQTPWKPGEAETAEAAGEAVQVEEPMIIVDVVIVRTDENITTRKGVNLLSGLKLQFGTGLNSSDITDVNAFEFLRERDTGGAYTTTLKGLISVPAIEYSLNIFNSHTDRAEILARPTLIALNGEQSEFFSGVNVNAVSEPGGQGSSPIQINTDVGVRLVVTPTLQEQGRVKLSVEAERTFIRVPDPNIGGFTQTIETSKTHVIAKVEMNVGETLILSGLSEKETERVRDGVPFLQDIPLVQYFFSEHDARDFQRSVLILLTPRVPEYVFYEEGSRTRISNRTGRSRALTELQARYSDWFRPYPNWASVFHHLQSASLYREFRTGDVTMERWSSQQILEDRLKQAIGFLYY